MPTRAYLLSLPERVIRSAVGLGAGLLREVGEAAIRREARGLRPGAVRGLSGTVRGLPGALRVMPGTVRGLPGSARRLSASTHVGARHAGKLLSTAILDHYGQMLNELRRVGYLTYAKRQLSPYVRASIDQFSPQRRTLTQRLLDRVRRV